MYPKLANYFRNPFGSDNVLCVFFVAESAERDERPETLFAYDWRVLVTFRDDWRSTSL